MIRQIMCVNKIIFTKKLRDFKRLQYQNSKIPNCRLRKKKGNKIKQNSWGGSTSGRQPP
jgi:hypothetical protein